MTAPSADERGPERIPILRHTLTVLAGQLAVMAFGVTDTVVAGHVENIVGVLPGRDRSAPALALMAHYDSVAASPGAADDIMGVAAILETARAIKAFEELVGRKPTGQLTPEIVTSIVAAQCFIKANFVFDADGTGRGGAVQAYTTGRGSILMRAKHEIETSKKGDRQSIVFTAIPYQVNKARLIERIADLVRDKVMEGISDLRDESDRDGIHAGDNGRSGAANARLGAASAALAIPRRFATPRRAGAHRNRLVGWATGAARLFHRTQRARRAGVDLS